MSYKTSVLSREEIFYNLTELLKILKTLSNESRFAFTLDNSSRISQSPITTLIKMKSKNRVVSTFCQIILDQIIKCEKISAFSSRVLLKYFIFLIEGNLDKKRSHEKTEEILEKINKSLKRPKKKDLSKFLKNNFSQETFEIVSQALEFAGPSGKIKFEHSSLPVTVIEAKSQRRFNIIPEINIIGHFAGKWERENVITLCVEGFVEKVSEIDRILNYLVEKNEPCVIFALGFSPEIVSTILTNNQRGVIDVMLCCPDQNYESINDLGDISLATGASYHGYQTGRLSTSFAEDEISFCEKINIDLDYLVVENSKTSAFCEKKIADLVKDLGESEEKDEYLRRRITNLTSRIVKIIFPETSAQKKFSQIEEVDLALRSASSLMKYGILKRRDMNEIFKGSGIFMNENISSSVYTGVHMGYQLYNSFQNLGSGIFIDD